MSWSQLVPLPNTAWGSVDPTESAVWANIVPPYWLVDTWVISLFGFWNDGGTWYDDRAWISDGSSWTELGPSAINVWTAIQPTQDPGWVQIAA